jgi:PAS domain S-box-containing protein
MGIASGEAAGAEKSRLEEIEEIYRLTPVGLCVVDRELRYVRVNDAYAQIVGYCVDDLLGRTMWEVIPESARRDAVDLASRVIETGEPVLETEIRRTIPGQPELDRVWIANVHPVRREGAVTGAMAALLNITSVRRAEEEARERLSELESVYRNAPVGLSLIDRDLRYVRVNQIVADLNGVSVEEMIGKRYRDLAPDTADVAEPLLHRLAAEARSVSNLEVRSRPPGDPGNEHVFLLSVDPVRNARGDVVGQVAAVQDVTGIRRVEEAAARRLEELESLYASTPVGLCYTDTDLRIVHLNPLFARLSERAPEDLVGAPVTDLLPAEIARDLVPQMRHIVCGGLAAPSVQLRYRLPGAREYVWIAHTHPTRSREGEVTGIITVLQDVTELVNRQREVEVVRDRLAEAQSVARVGSWEWNLLADEVWWSRELYEIFGEETTYTPSYLGFFEHVHPRDRQKVRAQIDRTLADDRPYRVTFRIHRPDGSERVLFTAARLVRTEAGVPARLVGTVQDVTESGPLDAATED